MTISLGHAAGSDPRLTPTAFHVKMFGNNNAMDSYSYGYNGGTAWFSNFFNTTLGSYELAVSYYADITSSQIVYYHRDMDSVYANNWLFWYYNTRLDVNTTLYRQSATVASTIHFTGPFQAQNVEVAVDMHAYSGYATDDLRMYIFGGNAQVM